MVGWGPTVENGVSITSRAIEYIVTIQTICLYYRSHQAFETQAIIGSLKSLTDLNLEENLFTGQLPANIGQLHNLSYLGISFNKSMPRPPHMTDKLTCLQIDLSKSKLQTTALPTNGW